MTGNTARRLARVLKIGPWGPLAKPLRAITRRYVQQGNLHRDNRNWDEARRAYDQALQLDPSLSHIWVQYGHASKESGDVLAALEAYDRSIELNPNFADTHLQRGHALKVLGRTHDAALAYARAYQLEPLSPRALGELRHLGFDLDRLPRKPIVNEDVVSDTPATKWKSDLSPSLGGKISALLEKHALLPTIIKRFDSAHYAETYSVKLDESSSQLYDCLKHFCETGLNSGAEINECDCFDPAFYRETYGDVFRMSNADTYRHWLNVGIATDRSPNLAMWLKTRLGLNINDVSGLNVDRYRAAVQTSKDLRAIDLVTRFVDGDRLEDSSMLETTPAGISAIIAISRRAASYGKIPFAMQLLEWLLSRNQVHQARSDYADRLVDAKQFFVAGELFRQIIANGQQTRWTYTLLAECLREQGLFQEAVQVLTEGALSLPHYPALRRSRWKAIDQLFHATVRDYEIMSRLGEIPSGQALVAEYGRVSTASLALEHLTPRPIRSIALFALLDLPQCRFYRVDQKIEQLELAGYGVKLYDATTGLDEFLAEVIEFEAVIFYRVAPLPNIIPAIHAANELGLATFYEIDDLLFLPEEYPGRLESYAGQISPETFAMLAMGVPLFAAAMRMCKYALASTPALARAMAPFVSSGQAFVHRNGMGRDHERYLDYVARSTREGPVVLFYGSGTRAHKEDFQLLLEPALTEVARRHGSRVAIVLVGWLPISDALRESAVNLTVIEPSFDLHGYWNLLKEADVNLAVLAPSLNVDCKSEIKWMEAAMFGIPSVVSRTSTYSDVLREGETGFMCDTVVQWVDTLDRLIRDPSLRRAVGVRAQELVRQNYCIEAMAGNLRKIIDQVSPAEPLRRKKILIVNVFYTPQTIGGATRVVHDNIVHIKSSYGDEFELEVFTTVDEAGADYVVASYVQDGIRVTGITSSVESERREFLSDPKMEAVFRRHVTHSAPDLIHFHCIQRLSLAVTDVARELRIPYVITAHDAWWISDNQFLIDKAGRAQTYDYADPLSVLKAQGSGSFGRMQTLRPALFGARYILGVSAPFSDLHKRCGVPNVRTIANGVSTLPPCVRVPSPEGYVTLGHVGGIERHKGFHLLRQTLRRAQFQHLRLLVVDHSENKSYERTEVWGSTSVRIIGRVPHDEICTLYGQIDVMVAPSVWSESFGLATREAQACGCWVVASDRGAIGTDITEDVNGHRVDVSTTEGLNAVLLTIDRQWQRYRQTPPALPVRSADTQGDELAVLYRGILESTASGAACH